MTHKTTNHIELEDGDTTVVVDDKNYDTIVITVMKDGGEVHSLEVEDCEAPADLHVIE